MRPDWTLRDQKAWEQFILSDDYDDIAAKGDEIVKAFEIENGVTADPELEAAVHEIIDLANEANQLAVGLDPTTYTYDTSEGQSIDRPDDVAVIVIRATRGAFVQLHNIYGRAVDGEESASETMNEFFWRMMHRLEHNLLGDGCEGEIDTASVQFEAYDEAPPPEENDDAV